jgi:hypothetical protein
MPEPKDEQPLHVRGEEKLNLAEPLKEPPSLEHQKEKNSAVITVLYVAGILALLAISVILAAALPFWLLAAASSTLADARFTALVESLKSTSSLLSSLTSGLLTALGIGIGYFFRRSGSSKD